MSLASDPLEPLVLADGTKINPATGEVIKEKKYSTMVEIPSGSQAQAIVAKSRRAVAELPLPPKQMNVVSVVLFYSMWGLADGDIAIALGISTKQVKNIKELPEYQTIAEDIKKSVLEYEANDVRAYLQQRAKAAAAKIVDTLDEEGALGFAAAKDILDRTGNRPADVVEHRHKMEDSLRIEIVQRRESANMPENLIDVTDYKEMA